MSADCFDQRFTALQQETLQMLAQGQTSKEVAKHWRVSAAAIDQRVESMRRKTGCSDRRDLIRWYMSTSDHNRSDAPQVGESAYFAATSTSEQIRLDVDEGRAAVTCCSPPTADMAPFPETDPTNYRPGPSVSWLGARITLFEAAVGVMLLHEIYVLLH